MKVDGKGFPNLTGYDQKVMAIGTAEGLALVQAIDLETRILSHADAVLVWKMNRSG